AIPSFQANWLSLRVLLIRSIRSIFYRWRFFMKLLRRTKLFRRLPTPPLFWRPKGQQAFISNDQSNYPLFADDFALLEQELMPVYQKLDNKALEMQNQFRFYQILL